MQFLGRQRSDPDESVAVALRSVSRTFGRGRQAVHALRDVNESFLTGTFTAIMGPSGSGKSTLIQCAAGLDKPSSGKVLLGDIELSRIKEPKLTEIRRRRIGFIFQAFNLLPALDAMQNILLPLKLDGHEVDNAWLNTLIDQMGLEERIHQHPSELSGGQQQRVAIARALVTHPLVVFADEPTGELDLKTARSTLALLRSSVDRFEQTMIMVTHDPVAASYADHVLFLADGQVVDRMEEATPERIGTHLMDLESLQQ